MKKLHIMPKARAMNAPLYNTVNTQTRIVAVLNDITGQVTYLQRTKIGRKELPSIYARI